VRTVKVHVEVRFDSTDLAGGDAGGRCPVLINKVGAYVNIIKKNLRENVDLIHVAQGKELSGHINCCKVLEWIRNC
jgi:hypothetical protein